MFIKVICILFGLGWLSLASADVSCDGVDDVLSSTGHVSMLGSATTFSLSVWYKPVGTADSLGTHSWDGGGIFGDNGGYLGLYRNNNYGGVGDRIAAFNYDGTDDEIPSTYTIGDPTHLALVHTGGNLLLYKDGVLVSSIASGTTSSVSFPVTLCRAYNVQRFDSGIIAAAETYATALSADQIGAIGKSRLFRLQPVAPSASWDFSTCTDGTNCDGIGFLDRSGNAWTNTATGGTGKASDFLSYPWGVE